VHLEPKVSSFFFWPDVSDAKIAAIVGEHDVGIVEARLDFEIPACSYLL